jgi:hypothetical protein
MPKIVQISVASEGDTSSMEAGIYGLGENGKLYYWGRKKVKESAASSGIFETPEYKPFVPAEYIHGWIEMVDQINAQ